MNNLEKKILSHPSLIKELKSHIWFLCISLVIVLLLMIAIFLWFPDKTIFERVLKIIILPTLSYVFFGLIKTAKKTKSLLEIIQDYQKNESNI